VSPEDVAPWYLAEATRAEQLLGAGRVIEAREAFEGILARLGEGPSHGRAVVLGRLGRCAHVGGEAEVAVARLRDAIDITRGLAPGGGAVALRGQLHSDLGDALRVLGRYDEARAAYETALATSRLRQDRRAQGIDLGRLGALARVEGRLDEALSRYRQALELLQQAGAPALEAAVWHQLGRVQHARGERDEAERHYREAARLTEAGGALSAAAQTWSQLALLAREGGDAPAAEAWLRRAIDAHRATGDGRELARVLRELADLLRDWPDRLGEAAQLAGEAVASAQALDPVHADAWSGYGLLAAIVEREAAAAMDDRRAALEARARDYRQVEAHAPRLLATLARLGESPGLGRAVVLGQLGRCLLMGGRPDLAAGQLRRAIEVAGALGSGAGITGLRGSLHLDLGDALGATGRLADARDAYAAALALAGEREDLRGRAAALDRLGALAGGEAAAAEGRPAGAEAPPAAGGGRPVDTEREPVDAALLAGAPVDDAFEIAVSEEELTDYGFDTDLLIEGRRARRLSRWSGPAGLPDAGVRPRLVPCARTWIDDDGAIRFGLPAGEPQLERHPGCTVIRRTCREVAVAGHPGVVWRVIRAMDGTRTAAAILAGLPGAGRAPGGQLLAALAATGVIDVSGRPIARFLHAATKKGVLPGGGLGNDDVLRLATDGDHRAYPGAPRIAVDPSVPGRLGAFHALTRARRSSRDYRDAPVARADFDALLSTACGVTGALGWAGREVKLRAYPSSGALYAVEIYPVVFRVEGLAPAVYHFRPAESVLEVVRPALDRARVVAAALPVEREMVAGAAAIICLAARFARHERKYGEGGYRMLVAEAGHISQNLVLAATALGLGARPFGGVLDDLLNEDLGLDGSDEQFLLAVLVGPAGPAPGLS
jgi:SagB-type dehydrogenase family enzyme